MAGIGFALRELIRKDNLVGPLQGYLLAVFITCGPWLFTVFCLLAVQLQIFSTNVPLDKYYAVISYNFSLSMVASAPVVWVMTRYLADGIFLKKLHSLSGTLLPALACQYLIGLFFIVPFYASSDSLSPMFKFIAILNYFLIVSVWVTGVFLTVLKDYLTYVTMFALGMVIALIGGWFLGKYWGAEGLLCSFNLGITVILFSMLARIFNEYPLKKDPLTFFSYFKRYWDLAVIGLLATAGIWIDKWVMWIAAPERIHVADIMIFYPDYDHAMFIAYLIMIPAIAIFFVTTETGFFEKYNAFYQDIKNHATYEQICVNHAELKRYLIAASRNIIVLQGAVTAAAVFLGPKIIEIVGGQNVQIAMLRQGILGSFFHVMLMLVTIVFAYFDLRRLNLAIQLLFLILNGSLTYLTITQGFSYYGYGYFLAAFITFIIAYILATMALHNLPYLTFIKNNPSIEK